MKSRSARFVSVGLTLALASAGFTPRHHAGRPGTSSDQHADRGRSVACLPLPPVPTKRLPADVLPDKLSLWIGGIGDFSSVEWVGNELSYKARRIEPESGRQIETQRTIRPSTAHWRDFWNAIEELQIWRWRPRYDNNEVTCGTSWGVEIELGGRRIRSAGHNAYPGAVPNPPAEGPYTGTFERYLGAVRALLGGQDFR